MEKLSRIKAGWVRALLFLVVGLAISSILVNLVQTVVYNGWLGNSGVKENTTADILLNTILPTLVLLFTVWLFRTKLDVQSFYSLGFQWKGYSINAFAGFLTAIIVLSVGTLILVAGSNLNFGTSSIDVSKLLTTLLLFILVAFVEEAVFRGYILNNLMQSLNKWLALLIASFLFAIMHTANTGITFMAFANIFIAGLLLGVNYIYTKNLWFAIALHFAWNFFQGPILGYHVSGLNVGDGIMQQKLNGPDLITGGSFGFEGSIFASVLQLIAIAIFVLYYERKTKLV